MVLSLVVPLLHPTPNDPVSALATINESVRIPDTAPMNCATIQPSVLGDTQLVQNFNIPAIIETLNEFKRGLNPSNVLLTETFASTESASLASILAYLTSLRTVDYPKLQLVDKCVAEQVVGADPLGLETQKQVTEESKSRLAAITAPETHVSYYESWFPRPMKEDAIFGLFGTALFLLLVSVAFFLGMSGIEFQILAPTWVFPVIDFTLLTSRTPVMIMGVGAGLILGVVGHYLKWF